MSPMSPTASVLPTDVWALLGIDLVLCAVALRLTARWTAPREAHGAVAPAPATARWAALVLFVLLWWPVGQASLPLLGYVRGVASDFSVTLVALAVLSIAGRLAGWPAVPQRERHAVYAAVALAAVALYPSALGWGDVDLYRAGWGSPWMGAALLAVALLAWCRGLWLLPSLLALAVLGWCAGLMESRNLWDHLLDPWLAVVAFVQVGGGAWRLAWRRWRKPPATTR